MVVTFNMQKISTHKADS